MKRLLFTFLLSLGFILFIGIGRAYAYDIEVGNTAELRPALDTRQNFTIIDTNNPADFDGFLSHFDYYASSLNPFRFVLVDSSRVVKWVSQEITPDIIGNNSYDLETTNIKAGWNVGLYFSQTGTIPFVYDSLSEPAYYTYGNSGIPVVGETLIIDNFSRRIYSFVASGYKRFAEITSPEINAFVLNNLILEAYLIDNDPDNVQWAVRRGTCDMIVAANIIGNVAGMDDDYQWIKTGDYRYQFSAQADVSSWEGGMYCFIFNPTENINDSAIRLTREFYIAENDIHGGGQIIEENGDGPKDDYKISFGGQIWDIGSTYIGEWEVNFHNVGINILDRTKFHTTRITEINYVTPTGGTCTEALNFTAYGTLGNEIGEYKLVVRAGDYDSPGQFTETSFDTIRFELYRPDKSLLYDTHISDFEDQSTCAGTARTGLDNGNLTIIY